MNRSLVIGVVVGAAFAAGAGAVAGLKMTGKGVEKGPEYAQVLEVTPISQRTHTPRQDCHDESVTHQAPLKDRDTYTTTEQKCATVYDTSEKTAGYAVRYRLGGEEATVNMDHDPGERIPVRNGQLDLAAAQSAKAN